MKAVEAAVRGTTGQPRPSRSEWLALTLVGAAAFWTTNLVISLTPVAAAYRAALSIEYVPMLVEAAVGGVVVAGVVALVLVRFPHRVPGTGPVRKALLLATGALVVLTLVLEVPSKLGADVDDAFRWLLVATAFNTVRVLALGLAIGLAARAREGRPARPGAAASKENMR
jgi:hypothetical protein